MDDHTGEKTHQDGVTDHHNGDAQHQGGEIPPAGENHQDGVLGTTVLTVLVPPSDPIPAFDRGYLPNDLRAEMTKAVRAHPRRLPVANCKHRSAKPQTRRFA